ncbi:MAG: glutaredoxin family protein [Acidimicrobiia bacterium]|nr:glutaredoxin family protein [Acidimicrobiia bacterium]MDH3397219.1 glutaredoxin family protein [Acidimicrobiia bacterium]
MSDFSLVFLTRSGCHLCEEAEPLVRRLAAEVAARVEARDIDADPVLLNEYTDRIPVVLGPSGRVLAEGIIAERYLRKALVAESRTLRSR